MKNLRVRVKYKCEQGSHAQILIMKLVVYFHNILFQLTVCTGVAAVLNSIATFYTEFDLTPRCSSYNLRYLQFLKNAKYV